jgi:hypothetical protein
LVPAVIAADTDVGASSTLTIAAAAKPFHAITELDRFILDLLVVATEVLLRGGLVSA